MKPVEERIKLFNSHRLPEIIPFKYKLMSENVFRFYRGTCHLFYEDMPRPNLLPVSPLTWICGDLHIENFGSFKGDNRLVYFDVNDFDEGMLAPAAWDLVRMVSSIFLAFETLRIDKKNALEMANLFLKTYSAVLSRGKARYTEPRTAEGIVCTFLELVSKRTQKELLKQRTKKKKEGLILILDNERYLKIDDGLKKELAGHITEWISGKDNRHYHYSFSDVAARVAGTGSIGVKRYIFLLRNLRNEKKYLLIDMKQANPSSLYPFNMIQQPPWKSEAERIISIQDRMQNTAPALLGTTIFQDDPYVLREMQPTSDKIDFNLIKKRYSDISQVIAEMGLVIASAQLRSSGRQGAAIADELVAFGNSQDWQPGIIDYSLAYCKRVKDDFIQYVKKYKEGYFK